MPRQGIECPVEETPDIHRAQPDNTSFSKHVERSNGYCKRRPQQQQSAGPLKQWAGNTCLVAVVQRT